MTVGLEESILGHQELLFHQTEYCPLSLAPDFENSVIGLEGLMNCLGEMVSDHGEMLCDLGVIVPALDEHYPPGPFPAKRPYGCEFQAEDLDYHQKLDQELLEF